MTPGSAPVPATSRRFGLAGWSGSGKTTLLVQLIPEIVSRGFIVSTLKRAHHGFDVDQPGKDSYEHRRAGATEVMVASAARWALMHELRGAAEPTAAELVAKMSPVDLVLIEGFKREDHPKLEVHRPAHGQPLLCVDDPMICALASDVPADALALPRPLPVLALDDVPAIASFILAHCGLAPVERR